MNPLFNKITVDTATPYEANLINKLLKLLPNHSLHQGWFDRFDYTPKEKLSHLRAALKVAAPARDYKKKIDNLCKQIGQVLPIDLVGKLIWQEDLKAVVNILHNYLQDKRSKEAAQAKQARRNAEEVELDKQMMNLGITQPRYWSGFYQSDRIKAKKRAIENHLARVEAEKKAQITNRKNDLIRQINALWHTLPLSVRTSINKFVMDPAIRGNDSALIEYMEKIVKQYTDKTVSDCIAHLSKLPPTDARGYAISALKKLL